ncbi:uncharacterized protein LOC129913617 [Episyrphus balteatus]|uniref:uncharacterized protein LOC129913617 n=1 Tax=Episyrphus balteatus TaxID=286459 RepID=UPI0024865350|nr:uncharacterized protein LOC129913617 [Episyrphus balteatus]
MPIVLIMRLLVVLLALTAVVLAEIEDYDIDLVPDESSSEIDSPIKSAGQIQPRFIISWQVRRQLKKLRKRMPCGFPDQGVPPLAPYRLEELKYDLKTSLVETINDIFRFKVDGLDNFKIKKFTLNIIKRRVQFNFLFKKIRLTGKYNTNTLVKALNDLGVNVRYEGQGDLDFSLEKLQVSGNLKYKLPILIGSAKITEFYATVEVGNCKSNITGLAGEGKYNRFLNDKLESSVVSGINDNKDGVSAKIEQAFVPRVNKALKGTNFWDIWDYIFNSGSKEEEEGSDVDDDICIPPPDPWA